MWRLTIIIGSIISLALGERANGNVGDLAASGTVASAVSQLLPQQSNSVNGNSAAALTPPLFGWAAGDPGFAVQTGYEGYLVPSATGNSLFPFGSSSPSGLFGGPLGVLGTVGTGAHLLHSVIPHSKIALKIISKLGIWFMGFISLLLLGGLFTTAICAFTPICTISFFGFGLNRESMRSYLNPDRLTTITAFVNEAIDKYRDLQEKKKKKSVAQDTDNE